MTMAKPSIVPKSADIPMRDIASDPFLGNRRSDPCSQAEAMVVRLWASPFPGVHAIEHWKLTAHLLTGAAIFALDIGLRDVAELFQDASRIAWARCVLAVTESPA